MQFPEQSRVLDGSVQVFQHRPVVMVTMTTDANHATSSYSPVQVKLYIQQKKTYFQTQ